MNDNLEINGDLQDEMKALQEAERLEALEGAPEPDPLTEKEMDLWAEDYEKMQYEGKDGYGTDCWTFE